VKLLGNYSRGILFVVSAPSGTGKTTLVRMLQREYDCVQESISCTTRVPRGQEKEGVHYYFLSVEEFERRIQAEEFIEYAKVFGDYYGTSRKFVEEKLEQGYHVFLVIDTQGYLQIKEQLDAVPTFISPPSLEELRSRLIGRKTDTPEQIEERLSWAQGEMKQKVHYDYHIVNDDLEIAYQTLRSIVVAEEHRTRRR